MKRIIIPIMFLLMMSFAYSASDVTGIQGLLKDSTGALITDTKTINVSLLDASSINLWNETFSQTISSGLFDIVLGNTNSLSIAILLDATNWSVKVENEAPDRTPPILKAPFSFISDYALDINWTNISNKPANLDTDSTDDLLTASHVDNTIHNYYKEENFTTQHTDNSIHNYYQSANWTTDYNAFGGWKLVNLTDRIPTCTGDDKLTSSDGIALSCASDQTGGVGGANMWVDEGNYLSPNTTYAQNINGTIITTNYKVNLSSNGDVNATKFYGDGSGITNLNEDDPEVDQITANLFCRADAGGNQIDCGTISDSVGTCAPSTVCLGGHNHDDLYLKNSTDISVNNVTINTNLTITGLISCDTIDTDANGLLTCGSDASGAGVGLWKIENFTAIHTDNTIHNYYGSANWTTDYNAFGVYKKANVTADYPNLDQDQRNDLLNSTDASLNNFTLSQNLTITGLISCDTIDTDANGMLTCGSDNTGAGVGTEIYAGIEQNITNVRTDIRNNITLVGINLTTIYNNLTQLWVNISAINNSQANKLESVALNEIQNPTGDSAFAMTTRQLKFTWTNPAVADGALELEASGAFSGDLMHIHQHTGNTGEVDLLHIEAEDVDVLPFRVTTVGDLNTIFESGLVNVTSKMMFGSFKVNISSNGDVNATKFYGDGSALTGISTGAGAWVLANFTAVHTDNTIHNYFTEANNTNIILNLTTIHNNLSLLNINITAIWANITGTNNSEFVGSAGGGDPVGLWKVANFTAIHTDNTIHNYYASANWTTDYNSFAGAWRVANFTAVHTDNSIHNYYQEVNNTNMILNMTAIQLNLTQIWINISAINNSKTSGAAGADGTKIANNTYADLTTMNASNTVTLNFNITDRTTTFVWTIENSNLILRKQ